MLSFDETFSALPDPQALAVRWKSAGPFPHVVIDGAFPDVLLDEALASFPAPTSPGWVRFDNEHERKLGYRHGMPIDPRLELMLARLNSWRMVEWLEKVTGIEGLVSDPWYGGGGLHLIEPGGFLDVHADFNIHPKLRLDRRLNALLYLNRGWREEWGGHLELWHRDRSVAHRIAPLYNRLVIFETSDESLHGHPQPLQSPDGVCRRSISLYFYTAPSQGVDRSFHDTLFV